MQQARHAKRALQGVFEVVITRVAGLVVLVFSPKAILQPTQRRGDKGAACLGKHRHIHRLHFSFHRGGDLLRRSRQDLDPVPGSRQSRDRV